ncbi:ADP-ribose pyrophosphatase YjhB, NUDIX family [Actinopolymorpha cephalotaxi]|uniref:8-oxo-dGTP pyrophosphatase MutT (NUDIX family) n=1 Tax=Actinopolymorpha cephalotaxi TaxID=504797 RepID=A0A1I2PYB1_9ACTN|nr:NUDIX hydrolase [Actinopolymorpha cephalotaxi]NYH83428.1 8-oxo-dGTP pyrophosphatase MutT (NUDIX family) [Actinopolymorpha cephalotaxi]SFG21018.1 ADP-ribose pyrophosphatase YjhB, NUDIX family [Actinopolymorpha cephalotaxi]
MRWTVHGEREIYSSDWVRLTLVDVEVPGLRRFDHHVLRMPRPAAGVVVHDPERGLLLLYRHRFITDTWGWEIPAGGVDAGESPAQAAGREVLEETGWRPGPLRELAAYHPSNGIADQRFHLFLADGATRVGAPSDPSEAERVEWVPLPEVRRIVRDGRMRDGLSFTAVLYALAFDEMESPDRPATEASPAPLS